MSSENACNLHKLNIAVVDQILNPTFTLASEALIDIAYISNETYLNPNSDLTIDNTIILDHYDLSFLDFTTCFYSQPTGTFHISSSNQSYKPILINHQTYTSVDCKKHNVTLYNILLKTYASKHNISENKISPIKRICLANEVLNYQSLATSNGIQTTLSWDAVINTFLTAGQLIFTGDTDHEARVSCKITYVYYSKILNITVSFIFTYNTLVPCYKNVYSNIENNIINSYSKYEHSTIEEIKKDLTNKSVQFKKIKSPSLSSKSINKSNDDNINYNEDEDNNDDNDGCSTIKTLALLKDFCSNWKDEIGEVEENEEYVDNQAVW